MTFLRWIWENVRLKSQIPLPCKDICKKKNTNPIEKNKWNIVKRISIVPQQSTFNTP